MKTKLTGVTIRNLKPAKDGSRVNYFDTQHKSLCLRVGTRDKVWSYHYRFNGKLRSPALGKYAPGRVDHMDRAAAISAANLIDDQITQGVDPKHNSKPIKAKPTAKNPNTYSKRVDQFIKYYKTKKKAPKSKTIKETEAHLTGTHITSIKHSDVKKITRAQLVKLLEDMHETPIQANRLHASLSIFFRWCWDHEYVDVTPLLGLNKRFVEQPRKRYLTSDEIEKFWKGCKELSYPTGNIYLLALVTGQRPGECRKLNRNDIYDDIWLVEGGDPKNKERHRIPLPRIAKAIISKAPTLSGPYVFSTTDGNKPCTQSGKTYEKLYKAVGLSNPWQPRDLRRTFTTIASEELDIEPHLHGAVCNQNSVSKPGVASIYNKASWIKQKRKVLKKWNDWLLKVVNDG